MGKKWLIIIIIGIILAIICGVYAYNKNGESDTNIVSNKKLADTNNEVNHFANVESRNESIMTSSINMNISPNAVIIEKRYYKACDHLIKEIIDVPEEMINKTEIEVRKKYADWELEGYSPTEIVLYKEFSGFCEEHYIAREHDGVIGIYTVDEEGIETLKEDTEISTQYLSEKDIENLRVGIKIIGKKNLYSFLEDYE